MKLTAKQRKAAPAGNQPEQGKLSPAAAAKIRAAADRILKGGK